MEICASIDGLIQSIVSALRQLKTPGWEYNRTLLDLGCVRRTAYEIVRKSSDVVDAQDFSELVQFLSGIDDGLHQFIAQVSRTAGERPQIGALSNNAGPGFGSAFENRWAADIRPKELVSLGRWAEHATSLEAPGEYVTSYGDDVIVSRSSEQNRYQLGADCSYEKPRDFFSYTNAEESLMIFEHVGLTSGGTQYYDPNFFSRGFDSAREFFKVGRVFMMLWDIEQYANDNQEIIDDDANSILQNRQTLTSREGSFTGPFTGPTTVRCFLVVKEGYSASFCVPISTFNRQGCSQQPDQANYGIIFTGDTAPLALPGELGMTEPPLRIQTQRLIRPASLQMRLNEPSIEPWELPSTHLPCESRVDYRRWYEVEHNIRCRNVGMLDHESLQRLSHPDFRLNRDRRELPAGLQPVSGSIDLFLRRLPSFTDFLLRWNHPETDGDAMDVD
ncbi:hypothetical protein FQN53_008443 [Emmonsiellopsis sp. PD_33]|nr:hypothetical protein FQN53_008443 [Emmonsiellopsis sp. PD_33]